MVLYMGDRKSWEGQFSNHLEEIMAFTLYTIKAVTALLVICIWNPEAESFILICLGQSEAQTFKVGFPLLHIQECISAIPFKGERRDVSRIVISQYMHQIHEPFHSSRLTGFLHDYYMKCVLILLNLYCQNKISSQRYCLPYFDIK